MFKKKWKDIGLCVLKLNGCFIMTL
jgi:hypothetical protein